MKTKANNSLVALIITITIVIIGVTKNELGYTKVIQTIEPTEVVAMSETAYNLEKDLNEYITNNQDIFNFYCNTFEIDLDSLKNIILANNTNNKLNYLDIFNESKEYNSLDANILAYLSNLEMTEPKLFKNKYESGTNYSKEYIYNLINYFCNLYGNVDYQTLAGITYIETGNLNSKTMLKANNIYGGMSNSGLIKYKNINYGIYSYVKMMSTKYYGKGLTSLESIGLKYNPITLSNGKKVANPTWVSNIKSILYKFDTTIILSISDILK
jgi:hypothetical protein